MTPPTDTIPRIPARLWCPCVLAVAAAAVWSMWPMARTTPDTTVPVPARSRAVAASHLDLAAFDAPIWVAPPPDPPAAAPPEPLRLQLLAVFRDGEELRAALYDPDSDRLCIVASGDTVGGRVIERVLADAVALRDGAGLATTITLQGAGEPP